MHLPVAVDTAGVKISKQDQAGNLDGKFPSKNLFQALQFLGQRPPAELESESPGELLSWAVDHWQPSLIKGVPSLGFTK